MAKTLSQFLFVLAIVIAVSPGSAFAQHVVHCGEWGLQPDRQHLRYDATHPLDLMIEFRVSIFEQGYDPRSNRAEVCETEFRPSIYFWTEPLFRVTGHTGSSRGLDSEILAPDGRTVSSSFDPVATPPHAYTQSYSNETLSVPFKLRVTAGQFQVPRGRQNIHYATRRQISFRNCRDQTVEKSEFGRPYTVFSECGPLEIETFEDDFRIPVFVVDTMSLRIAGAGRRAKVDFGTLERGEQKRLKIISRASRPYNIEVSSQNSGVMNRAGRGGSDWSIDYTLELDDQIIDLKEPTILPYSVSDHDGSERHDVRITIGAVDRVRAGRYRDVVTFLISPRL